VRLGLFALALLSSFTIASGSAPQAPPPNIDISQRPGNDAEEAIAVNPTNPQNVVVVWDRGRVLSTLPAAGMFAGVSFDGGRTWTRRLIAAGDDLGGACCDPSLSFDGYGNLFLTYTFKAEDTLPVALSTDGGLSFKLIANLDGIPSVDQPTITAAHGEVWVVADIGGSIGTFGARVTGRGQVGRFSDLEVVPGTNDCSYGDVAIGPAGEMMQVCTLETRQGTGKIFVNVDPDGLGPKGFGNAVFVADSHIGGFHFIAAQPERSIDAEPGLAWDWTGGRHKGRIYLVYAFEESGASDNMDLYLRHSDDEGLTWSAPVRVNDDKTSTSQFLPKVALDPTSGKLAVVWYDARNDSGSGRAGDTDRRPNDDAQLWGAFSTDGQTFTPNVQISAGTSNSHVSGNRLDYGDYTALAFYDGLARPAWADNSNSTRNNPDGKHHQLDVYTAAVRAP
jgi:hypothetical protein